MALNVADFSETESHKAEMEEENVKGWERPGYPHTLWELFTHEVQMAETSEVLNQAVILLAGSGITQSWHLEDMTLEELDRVIPQANHMREYMATKRVIKYLNPPQSSSSGSLGDVAAAVLKLAKASKTETASRKRKGPLDTDSEEESKFKVEDALWEYGLDGIPHQHMPSTALVENAARKAQSCVAAGRPFVAPGALADYCPQSVKNMPKDQQQQTHAHWVAQWWSRTLAQLAAQSACKKESFSVQTLLAEFLNMDEVAMQANSRTGWAYDQEKWTTLRDRSQRYERDLDLEAEMKKMTYDD